MTESSNTASILFSSVESSSSSSSNNDPHSAWERLVGSTNVPHASIGSWDNVKERCIQPVLSYIPWLLMCYGLAYASLFLATSWRGVKLQKLAGSLSMYPAFFALIYASHASMMDSRFWQNNNNSNNDNSGTYNAYAAHEVRFHLSSDHCDFFANLYIATNIVQAIGQLQTEKPPLLYQLMGHHILSVICYGAGFYFDRFRWWTALAGCCEITNLFLVPVFACKEFFPEWKTQTWYLWNSRFLWITFVTHRLVLFPVWLLLWFSDRCNHWQVIHWVEGTIYPLTILGLNVLSFVWFLTIHKGLKKQTQAYLKASQHKEKKKL